VVKFFLLFSLLNRYCLNRACIGRLLAVAGIAFVRTYNMGLAVVADLEHLGTHLFTSRTTLA
jgi:hypothetical protein